MPKLGLVVLILTALSLTAVVTLAVNNAFAPAPSRSEVEVAINQAQHFYRQKIARGEDLSNGPCLTEILMPNWAVDIVHNPRQPIDDLPENQCQLFKNGSDNHFVELDLDGNLVKVQ